VDYQDFGKFLIQQRELRGLSRDDVARQTRIPMRVIYSLEQGEVDQLPGRVFVMNYIRAYARVIGLSPDEAVLRYEEVDATVKMMPPPAALERNRQKQALLWLTVFVLLAAGAVAAMVYFGGQGAELR
jgi:cytoskeletal protein RodZ